MLKDSGSRREFKTGAVRDCADGKGRCDLLPLIIIGEYMQEKALVDIGRYVYEGDTKLLWAAIVDGTGKANIEDVALDVAIQYEEGAKKYNDRNWEKGQPLHCYIDSGTRHYLKYLRGDTDENHLRAFAWNMLGAIWTHTNKPELIDLPFKEQGGTGVTLEYENRLLKKALKMQFEDAGRNQIEQEFLLACAVRRAERELNKSNNSTLDFDTACAMAGLPKPKEGDTE